MFIGNEKFEGTGIAFQASLQLLDFAFERLQLKTVYAKVHDKNQRAIHYNLALGFEKDGSESDDFLRLQLNKKNYIIARKSLSALLAL